MRTIEKLITEKQIGATSDLLYARVDLMCMDDPSSYHLDSAALFTSVENSDNWVVAEVELVEPFLYMTPLLLDGCETRMDDVAIHASICNCIPADKLAEAIQQHLSRFATC